MQTLVLPIVTIDTDGTAVCCGTGFVIVALGRKALMVTATHVFADVKRVERKRARHRESTPDFFRPVEFRTELVRVRPLVYFAHPNRGAFPALIEATLEMPNADLCLCSIRFRDHVPDDIKFITRFGLDTTPMSVGERVVAFGYAQMTNVTRCIVDGMIEHSFDAIWCSQTGDVTNVFPEQGPPPRKYPSFQINVRIPHGTSGGPVISQGADGHPYVRGVVSSGSDWSDEALASMLWPIMTMPTSLPQTDGTLECGQTLLDLQREGTIIDRGNASKHIRCTRGENGQVISACWE